MDVMPTILDVLGLPGLESLDGESLVATMRGDPQPERRIFGETSRDADIRTLRKGDWKLLWNRRSNTHTLYNTRLDPAERANMALFKRRLLGELKKDLDSWVAWVEKKGDLVGASEGVALDKDVRSRLKALGYVD
jgi:arylsulfatase A-like enzyme